MWLSRYYAINGGSRNCGQSRVKYTMNGMTHIKVMPMASLKLLKNCKSNIREFKYNGHNF